MVKYCYTISVNGRFLKKNVVLITVVLVGIVLAFISYTQLQQGNTIKPTITVNSEEIQRIVNDTVSLDTDGDGLKDWEEVLLGTDVKNQDTDGDGTTDKDEVDQNRDPLVVGPDDSILLSSASLINETDSITKDRTVTEDLAIKLFTSYMKLKPGDGLNTINSDELVSEVISRTVRRTNAISYNIRDVDVVENPNEEVVSLYDAGLTRILRPDPSMKNDLIILKQILETKNADELTTFDTSMKYYREIVAEMLLLSVPKPISTEHIKAVNALSRVTENIESMKAVFVDPLSALVGVKEYIDNERIFIQNLSTIGSYLNTHRNSDK